VVEESYRLFNCARCHCLVAICRSCDHGNIYCGEECAEQQRHATNRRSGQRYQRTYRGRLNHAARQMRYRERQARKVTHHPFPLPSRPPKVRLARTRPVEWAAGHREKEGCDGRQEHSAGAAASVRLAVRSRQAESENAAFVRCDFCGRRCAPWARLGPQWD